MRTVVLPAAPPGFRAGFQTRIRSVGGAIRPAWPAKDPALKPSISLANGASPRTFYTALQPADANHVNTSVPPVLQKPR